MITLQQMQYISVLAEELHFLKASERCFVSQPTLSMQVKKAEETLGGIIFDRSSIPLKLTSFGKQILPVVRDVLEENEKLSELMGRLKGNLIEEIKIGIIPTIAVYMIPSIFSLLKDSLTRAKITFEEMKTEELILALENHKIDLGIMAGPFIDVKIESIQLFREQILVYCRELIGDNLRLEQLQDLKPWLLNNGNCLRNQMWNFCELNNSSDKFDWDYHGGNIDLLMKMVEQNGGYTLIPENIDIPADKRVFLKTLENKNSSPAREIVALFPRRTMKKSTINEIIRVIKSKFPTSDKGNLTILDWK